MKAPQAKKVNHSIITHGHERIDPYFWMNNREDQDVIDYLTKENEYTRSVLKDTEKLQKQLYKEIRSRIQEKDESAPYLKNGYWYGTKFEEGEEYPIHYRRKDGSEQDEVIIDEREHAGELDFYELVSFAVSPDNQWLLFSEDLTGRRLYQTRLKNLMTGEISSWKIPNTGGDLAWTLDNQNFYFSVKDENSLRPFQIYEGKIIDGSFKLVYTEEEDTFICTVSESKDQNIICIGSHSTLTTEFRYKKAYSNEEFQVLFPRTRSHEYYPEFAGDLVFLKTNLNAKNFKLVSFNLNNTSADCWEELLPHSEKVLIEDFEIFNEYIAVEQKENGLTAINIYNRSTKKWVKIPEKEETFTLYFGTNADMESTHLRVGYSSMTTPHTVYSIHLRDLNWTVLKQTKIIGGYDAGLYHAERVWAPSHDGVKVPVSLVYKKELFKGDGTNPILLYAYGSYGSTIDPYFSTSRLSLLDRGFVFAIAHVRGGEYLGTYWYEDGKLLKKKNTFHDFIAAGEYLIENKYGSSTKLCAMGGSAGGMLMGAVTNMRADLWAAVIAQVPFMDVVTTMLDDSIPLTTGEYDEWGNPNEKEYYNYMLSYSPYDNIVPQSYPSILVTSGLHDSQVQFWEPTKYVAKLRDMNQSNQPVLLETNMAAGHGGASGRFEQLKEIALEYSFLLYVLDIHSLKIFPDYGKLRRF